MVIVGVNECCNTVYGRNQFVFLFFVHLLLIGLNGTNAQNRAPRIKEHPSNTVSGRSEPATLRCVAEGRPKPTVVWYKDGAPLPPSDDGHRVMLEDGLLFLRVNRGKKDSDEGLYWCVARNIAGEAVSRNASLAVAVLREDFRVEPRDVQVAAGEPAILECLPPKGIPEPTVQWLKDDQPIDIEVNGRVTVTESGSLKILEALPTDSGLFRCVASNVAGERQSRAASLIVLRRPHFLVKPSNLTALLDHNVEFKCVSHDPTIAITWTKEGGSLPPHASAYRGVLKIDHVAASDAGIYSCRADSPAGTSIAAATLTVYALPHFTQIPSNLTAWEGDVVSIPCEAKGLPTPTTFWILEGTHDSLLFPECTKSNTSVLYLESATEEHSGRVICAAVNAAGSVMQAAFLNVLRKGNNDLKDEVEPSDDYDVSLPNKRIEQMTQYELVQARQYLQQNVLVLRRIETLSSTSLKVVWEVVTDYNEYLEGVKIWYNGTYKNWLNATEELHNSSMSTSTLCSNGSLTNVDNSGSSSFVLSGLMPYTQYDIFLMPFYKTLLGKPSNLISSTTSEEVPSAPPQAVSAGVINSTSAWIRWEPPPVSHWNGELTGFLIEIRVSSTSGGRIVGQMSLGPHTRAAAASSLRPGGRYSARAAATTRQGRGPFSSPVQIQMIPTHIQRQYVQTEPPKDGEMSHVFQETWLLVLCLTLFSIIIIGMFGFYFVKRRNGIQRKKSNGQAIVTAQQCLLNKDTIWLRERPVFPTSNDQSLEIMSCHQSLLHSGQSTSALSVEPEYSLPQNSIRGLDVASVDRLRRMPPEPYASSAIYTELNFKDNNEVDLRNYPERRSHNNSIVRSCNGSIQYSNGDCSTCCHSTSSRSTNRDYREPRCLQESIHNETTPEEDCQSCQTYRSGSRSRQDKGNTCQTNDLEYDYPQWHWLGRDNSFKIPIQAKHTNQGRADQSCQINLCDILPPPPYESPESKNQNHQHHLT